MSISPSASPTDLERKRLIGAVTKDAAGYLSVDLVNDTPAHIVKSVDAVIVQIGAGRR